MNIENFKHLTEQEQQAINVILKRFPMIDKDKDMSQWDFDDCCDILIDRLKEYIHIEFGYYFEKLTWIGSIKNGINIVVYDEDYEYTYFFNIEQIYDYIEFQINKLRGDKVTSVVKYYNETNDMEISIFASYREAKKFVNKQLENTSFKSIANYTFQAYNEKVEPIFIIKIEINSIV